MHPASTRFIAGGCSLSGQAFHSISQPDPETLSAPASSSIGSALTSALPFLQGTALASSSRKPLVVALPEPAPAPPTLLSSSKVGQMIPAYSIPSLRESPLNQMGGGGGREIRVGLPASTQNLTPCWTSHSPFQNPGECLEVLFSRWGTQIFGLPGGLSTCLITYYVPVMAVKNHNNNINFEHLLSTYNMPDPYAKQFNNNHHYHCTNHMVNTY